MDKIAIVNAMGVIESSASGGELEYVLIENTAENRAKLIQIGASEQEMSEFAGGFDENTIDISVIVFQHTNAKWFSASEGFLPYVPEDAPDWAK